MNWRRAVFAAVVLAALANAVGWWHARSLCRFTTSGEKTRPPADLGFMEKARVLLAGVRIPHPRHEKTPADYGLRFESIRIPSGQAGEPRLSAWRVPRKDAQAVVMLFHGYTASASQNLPAAAILSRLGYETVLVDFRGCGDSEGDETGLGYDEGRDVVRAYKALPDGRPVILLGESMGSAAILRAVADGGIAPAAIILEHPFDSLLHTVEARFRLMGLPAEPGAVLLTFWGGARHGFNGLRFSPACDARSVRCPALVFHGALDPMVSRAEAERVLDGLSGLKRFVEVPGVGHSSTAGSAPEAWRNEVRAFLRKALGQGSRSAIRNALRPPLDSMTACC